MKKLGNIVTITKIIDSSDDRVFYYTVKADTISWHFYTLVAAENFVKNLVHVITIKSKLWI